MEPDPANGRQLQEFGVPGTQSRKLGIILTGRIRMRQVPTTEILEIAWYFGGEA
jgi:hypothetical protein